MGINTLKGRFFMNKIGLEPTLIAFVVMIILVIWFFWYIYKYFQKKYITNPDRKEDPKKLLKGIILSLIIYFIGFLCAAFGAQSAIDSGSVGTMETILLTSAGFLVTIGLALIIYSLQALESKSTIDIIENRIEKKLKDITKDDIKNIILQASLKQLDEKLDTKRIEDEIINRVSSALTERNNK